MALTLTYAELAARLGRSEPAAKSLTKRKRWRRSVGNDGLSRVTLDENELEELADPDRRGPGRPPANSSRSIQSEPGPDPVQTLFELRSKLAIAEALAAERKDAFEGEHARAERLIGEVADLARQLATVTQEAGARERDLQARLSATERELAEMRSRPWWRRLVG
jgi:hypothetical protein